MSEIRREVLRDPVRRTPRGRFEVVIIDHDLRDCATSHGFYRWRWRARQVGHTWRRFAANDITVEIREHGSGA
jgi:hypothetical protein